MIFPIGCAGEEGPTMALDVALLLMGAGLVGIGAGKSWWELLLSLGGVALIIFTLAR